MSEFSHLCEMGSRRRLPAGTTLFSEGDEANDLIVINRGEVKITTVARSGQELVIEVLGGGELVGELSAIDGEPRSANAVALTDVEFTAVPLDRFLSYLQANPASMGSLLSVLVRRLRQANRRQLEFSAADALGRVCSRLDQLAERYGHNTEGDAVWIELSLTQSELAQWCGLSREAVVKALRKLRAVGWNTTGDDGITIEDRQSVRTRGTL
jgi:CRP-like cAMP-binding protein